MRCISVAFVLMIGALSSSFAWAVTEPAARQLLLRTSFAADQASVAPMLPLSQAQAVDRLVNLAAGSPKASTPPPVWVAEPFSIPYIPKNLSDSDRKKFLANRGRQYRELQAWWMQQMLSTPTPLTERMTLFWHGHFTSSVNNVPVPQLIYKQNVMLREHALGNYRELLHAVARDGAMLLYLNNQQNRKGKPNENFARELLELFTLGEGAYTEADIREAARAFTGWQTKPPDGRFVQVKGEHDDGIKKVFGQSGNFNGDDVIEIVLKQPRAAEFIVEELWREFISPQPDPAAARRLAADFRKDWELAPLMKALLKEPALQAADNAGSMVKSPIEFVVGTLRALQLPLSPLSAMLAADSMGQSLMAPPSVKGWPSGTGWITSQWLLARRQFVLALAGDAQMAAPGTSGGNVAVLRKLADREMQRQSAKVHSRFGEIAESLPVEDGDRQFLILAATQPPVEGAKPPDRLETWLLDPVYNLK